MRDITFEQIASAVAELCISANCDLPEDVEKAIREAVEKEDSPLGRQILEQIIENFEIARKEKVPICQDTGALVCFAELGQEVHIAGGLLTDAINEGVRRGYREGYLRKSIVADPLDRVNTGDNTPAMIHIELVEGDRLKLAVAPKGGGSENMSKVRFLRPADGEEGIKKFVVQSVLEAGGNPCPPIVVGVGIGGTLEKTALLAKKALFRPIGTHNANPRYADLEKELLVAVNETGLGPMALGGRTTALWVSIEAFPCHITALPVAVNLNCHAARHKEVEL
jgi:fumarate hydratase subunit alpha